ncbi:uncharacterized protein si:cabz01007802.1 isoform X2 [Electrophorus electricus]|uniref:uncharacterized protein si:cabz01007802.1 isoform X2 n=1 Tax=Electrophorus electricus TaxID=8005 RepID=UPI0015D04D03|nr:uncharacterized protein si:cabz01007802.1 isoform X2 [Electrophorus electricus]
MFLSYYWISGTMSIMQMLNPFKFSSQGKKEVTSVQHTSSDTSLSMSKSSGTEENGEGSTNETRQVVREEPPLHCMEKSSESSSKSSLTGKSGEDEPTESTQNPGLVMGLIQKVNPFKSSSQSQSDVSTKNTDESKQNLAVTQEVNTLISKNQEVMLASTTLTEPGSPKVLGFEWDHFKDSVEIPTVAEVPIPGDGSPLQSDDEDSLLEWWEAVEGWSEWNESTNFDEEDAEQAIEAAADRVFMAARLFLYLFNQREVLLHQRVHELLALADAADSFHKKTVTASIGGGVASVAGSITTITGLVLAPFTLGTSLIVTAVGVGIATAGGLTSASANITDTMHSRTDRAKVEQIILSYQEEIKDIKECLHFLQAGMETLEEWNFEQYVDSISKRAMNRSVKHVMKEGGRAGKALLVNAESLISTVQVLGAAGGAAKAAQAITVASGVMSGLFLALDVFFLAKDSMELRKGAKTEFAVKIREVCRELKDGLHELNKIKEQLQRIMDDTEDVEEKEEEDEEEEEAEEEEEESEETQREIPFTQSSMQS